jgi:hypothetical protein
MRSAKIRARAGTAPIKKTRTPAPNVSQWFDLGKIVIEYTDTSELTVHFFDVEGDRRNSTEQRAFLPGDTLTVHVDNSQK